MKTATWVSFTFLYVLLQLVVEIHDQSVRRLSRRVLLWISPAVTKVRVSSRLQIAQWVTGDKRTKWLKLVVCWLFSETEAVELSKQTKTVEKQQTAVSPSCEQQHSTAHSRLCSLTFPQLLFNSARKKMESRTKRPLRLPAAIDCFVFWEGWRTSGWLWICSWRTEQPAGHCQSPALQSGAFSEETLRCTQDAKVQGRERFWQTLKFWRTFK